MMGHKGGELLLHGIGIGEGLACGRLLFFKRRESTQRSAEKADAEAEKLRLLQALSSVKGHLSELQRITERAAGKHEAEIFEIHAMLLEDADLLETMEKELSKGACAEDVVARAMETHAKVLRDLQDPYLSARAKDLEDLSNQLLNALSGKGEASVLYSSEPYLLVADDLLPSETVSLDRESLLGFVMTGGSRNSHTAILARAMGIPALIGVGAIGEELEGELALLDAGAGTLCVRPAPAREQSFRERQRRAEAVEWEERARMRKLAQIPAVTAAGKRILVYANVGDVREAESAEENGADGIGLLRSELLYLSLDRYPTEDELAECYREIVEAMHGKRVVIRTLDVGADKQASYFSLPQEENPALGFRGVRVCLAREEVFKTQLRAILRASVYGRVSLMLPMIVSCGEVRVSRRLLSECMEELDKRKIAYDKKIELGVMIETPAAAIMCEELAREVDFFSVGTNDLVQYTLAADRQNPLVAQLCEANREPVLRLIEASARAIHKTGGWIGICGELAADLRLTQRFADMEIDELSVSVPYLLALRQRITECK